MTLTHFSLFSGIGGIDLASEWAGFTTVGQCEMADYPYKVLCKHWPDVPKWRDVRDVTADSVEKVARFSTVTLVSAGYPCQTFSLAGKRTGDLTLAKQFVRVVSELRPRWALGENVGGHITNGLDDVRRLFRDEGYATKPVVLRASDAGANHQRKRVFILAHTDLQRQQERNLSAFANRSGQHSWASNEDVAYTRNESDGKADSTACTEREIGGARHHVGRSHWRCVPEPAWTVSESELGRMAHGVSAGLDALGCLGNAVVPQQVYPILKAIAEIENGEM